MATHCGGPFIGIFRRRHRLAIVLLVSISGDLSFNAIGRLGGSVIARVTTALTFSTVRGGSGVKIVFFSSQVRGFVPPGGNHGRVLCVVHRLLSFGPRDGHASVGVTIRCLAGMVGGHYAAFVVDSFVSRGSFHGTLAVTGQGRSVMTVRMCSHHVTRLPSIKLVGMHSTRANRRR